MGRARRMDWVVLMGSRSVEVFLPLPAALTMVATWGCLQGKPCLWQPQRLWEAHAAESNRMNGDVHSVGAEMAMEGQWDFWIEA
jgi:hypothetical protein